MYPTCTQAHALHVYDWLRLKAAAWTLQSFYISPNNYYKQLGYSKFDNFLTFSINNVCANNHDKVLCKKDNITRNFTSAISEHIWVIRTRTGKKLDKCHFFLKSQRLLRTEKSKNSYTFKSYYLILVATVL